MERGTKALGYAHSVKAAGCRCFVISLMTIILQMTQLEHGC